MLAHELGHSIIFSEVGVPASRADEAIDYGGMHELRGLVRADRELTNGTNQEIIRDCFAWREIAPLPTSILLRPHTLQDCGLRASHLADGMTRAVFTDLEFERLAAMPNLRTGNAHVH